MNKPLDGLNEVGKIPQSGNGSVDEGSTEGQPSRARAQRPEQAQAFELAAQVENQSQEAASVREIILLHPRIRELTVAAAVRALVATKFYFNKTSGEMVHEPDYATQMKAVVFVAAYSDGLPVQTNMNINASAGKAKGAGMDEAAIALQSPALREELKRQIEAAERRDKSASEKKNATPV